MLSGNKDVTLVDFGLAAQAGEELEGSRKMPLALGFLCRTCKAGCGRRS